MYQKEKSPTRYRQNKLSINSRTPTGGILLPVGLFCLHFINNQNKFYVRSVCFLRIIFFNHDYFEIVW